MCVTSAFNTKNDCPAVEYTDKFPNVIPNGTLCVKINVKKTYTYQRPVSLESDEMTFIACHLKSIVYR